jgi:hypothetical protein
LEDCRIQKLLDEWIDIDPVLEGMRRKVSK